MLCPLVSQAVAGRRERECAGAAGKSALEFIALVCWQRSTRAWCRSKLRRFDLEDAISLTARLRNCCRCGSRNGNAAGGVVSPAVALALLNEHAECWF